MEDNLSKDIKKVAKGAGISLVGSFAGKGLWFLCQVIIVRFLGVEVFGLYVLGLTLLKITELLARAGLHYGAIRFVSIYFKSKPEKVKGTLISAFVISFANGIFIGTLVYLFAEVISESIFHKPELTGVLKSFAIGIPFVATMMVTASASQGFHTTKYSVYIKDIVQPLVNIVFVLLFILWGFGISGVIIAFILSHLFALLAGLYFIARQFPEIKDRGLRSIYGYKALLTYSTPLLVSGILGFLLSWTDVLMLGAMKTSEDVGIYRAASQVSIFLLLILAASNSIYNPAIANMHYLGQIKRLEKIFKITTRWVFLLTLPVALILIFSAKEVMSVFGPDFVERGAPVLVILTIAQLINCTTGGVGNTLMMTGKQNVAMRKSIALVIINIVLNYFLIPRYGNLGAALSTGISIGIINLLLLLDVYILYKIHPYNMSYLQGIISGIIAVFFLLFFSSSIPEYSNLTGLVFNSIVISSIFIAMFIITGFHNEDRLLFDALVKKFKAYTSGGALKKIASTES